jgi:hypothetical protein
VIGTSTQQGLKVTWTGVAGATSYRVYYRPMTLNANWTTVDTAVAAGTGSFYKTILPLYAGMPYAVMVAANNCPTAAVLGEPSAIAYGQTTNPQPACGPTPVLQSAVSSCPNQITVNLTGGPTWRVTLRRLSPSFSAGVTYQTTSPLVSFTMGSAPGGSVWEVFAVSVCAPGQYSHVSNAIQVSVKAPCEAPQNVVLSHATCNGFTASWNPYVCSGGVPLVNYQVYLKKNTSTNFVSYNVGLGDHKTFPMPALQPNTEYQVFVRAVACNGSVSASSPVQSITTGSAGCRDAEETVEPRAIVNGSESVLIYPNPTSGAFSVDVARAADAETTLKIEIVNAVGQVLQTEFSTASGASENRYVVPSASIASGVYLVRVTVGDNVYAQRLVVQKD